MVSKVALCNIALSRIGVSIPIASLDEASVAAEQSKIFYDLVLDMVLARVDWGFARTSKALADLGSPPTGWGFRYQYPTDCVQLRGLAPVGARRRRIEEIPPYDLSFHEGSKTIITDVEQAQMLYTARVTDTTLYPPMFANAFSWCLGAELVTPLSVDPRRRQMAREMYESELAVAAAVAANETVRDLPAECGFITARR